MTFWCRIFVNYISFDIYLVEPIENMTHTHTLSLSNYILSFHLTHTLSLSSLNKGIANFYSFFLFLILVYIEPDLVHQPKKKKKKNTKFGNSCAKFGARRGLNFRYFIQPSKTLLVKLTESHS